MSAWTHAGDGHEYDSYSTTSKLGAVEPASPVKTFPAVIPQSWPDASVVSAEMEGSPGTGTVSH